MKLKIYQIKPDTSCEYIFMSYKYAQNHGFTLDDYLCVWEENIDSDTSLDDLYTRFNIERPINFTGHSLSVSDIIELDGHKFYCDNISWVELKNL